MKRPTQKDIARIANVTHVTVSLALRGHRSIPKPTRERIEEISREIGYRPDPALSALMFYRRGARPSTYQGALAWVNAYQHPEKLHHQFAEYYEGAVARSGELGYKLEEFRLADLDGSFARLSKVLHARNIQGILFPPQEARRHISLTHFDWENFSMVAFGFSLMRPKLDVVTNAQSQSARLAIRKLRALGYRRIGFVEGRYNERYEQNFLAGFLIEQRRFSPAEQIPLHVTSSKSSPEGRAGFRKWFFTEKPDVVLAVNWVVKMWLDEMTPAERNGCGLALMDVRDCNQELSGINQNSKEIGRVAVDTLVSKIHVNERGIPAIPRRTLIEGRWMNGLTAPCVSRKGAREAAFQRKRPGAC